MSAARTIIPRLRVFVHKKPAVRSTNCGLPICKRRKALWPTRRGDTNRNLRMN